MSTDFYLQFLNKNNKGQRVVSLNENITLPAPNTGLPSILNTRRLTSNPNKTITRGNIEVPVLDIDSLKEMLFTYSDGYNTGLNQSVCVLGDPGMGKSAIVLATAKEICKAKYGGQREFVELSILSSNKEKYNEVYNNPSGYYIFIDVRMTAYEKYELKGTPFPSKKQEGTMEALFETWMAILFLPDAAGMLFLDEINQSGYETQTALYGLLHKDERTIGGRAIANKAGWSVHGAGNLPEDQRGVESLLAALQERFSTCWLEVTYESWIKWANTAKKITPDGIELPMLHPLVLGFLAQNHQAMDEDQFKNIFIKQKGTKGGGKGLNAPNPRNFVSISEALYTADDVIKMKGEKLINEVKALTESYAKLKDGTPDKARAYQELDRKQKELNSLLDESYLTNCYQIAAAKINDTWARLFKRYVAAQNININDIFEFEGEDESKPTITSKLTYKQDKGAGVETGSSPQQVTNSMGQLKEMIQYIIVQFIKDCGLGDYINGNKIIPHALGDPAAYAEFIKTVPAKVNKDIAQDFKYIARIYTIINTQIREQAKDLAAITWSYIANLTVNRQNVFAVFQLALDRNCTPQQLKQLKDDRGKDIAFNKQEMAAAMASLNAKLKEDIQGYNTSGSTDTSEDEEGVVLDTESSASLEEIDNLLTQSIKYLQKP
jgi:hypothetical protein